MGQTNKKVKILEASRLLQAKVGTGSFDKDAIQRSQDLIDKIDADFIPLARKHIKELNAAIEAAEARTKNTRDSLETLIAPIMQIKANAAMLRYTLIGHLAATTLEFLETLSHIDGDALDIVKAFRDTLSFSVNNNLSGDLGKNGKELQNELMSACKRYYKLKVNAPSY